MSEEKTFPCPHCGEPVIEGQLYCRSCNAWFGEEQGGTRYEVTEGVQSPKRFCKYCGRPLQSGAAFCSFCGKPQNANHKTQTPNPMPQQAYSQPTQQQPYERPMQQPAYMAGNSQPPQPSYQNGPTTYFVQQGSTSNGMGTAGFVLAILHLVLCWIPGLNFILWFLGVLFSLIGVFRKPKGLAIAGLVLSFIGIIITIAVIGTIIGISR